MSAQRFKGKVAVVTGGNSGIGLGVAKAYAQEGAQVAITGRNEKTLEAAAKEIGDGTLAIQSDAGKVAEIEAAMKKIKERFGRIDALFVNAGVAKFVPFEEVTEELFDETVDINHEGSLFYRPESNPVDVQRLGHRAQRVDQRAPGHAGDYGVRRDQSGRGKHGQDTLGRSVGKRHSGQCRQPGPDHVGASARDGITRKNFKKPKIGFKARSRSNALARRRRSPPRYFI